MDNRVSDQEVKRELTKEELQETQVLNLQEVKKAIRFEKITSKKPAIFVAVIGILLLLFGTSFQVLKTMKANSNVQKRTVTVPNKKGPLSVTKILKATKTTMNNPDSTNIVYNVIYYFNEENLIKESRQYNVSAVTGKEEGNKTIEKISKDYKTLLNNREGYKIEMNNPTPSVFESKIEIDYTKLDLTKVDNIQSTKEFTKLIYRLNKTYDEIRKDMLDKGFTVE